jgi:hypothetical protein
LIGYSRSSRRRAVLAAIAAGRSASRAHALSSFMMYHCLAQSKRTHAHAHARTHTPYIQTPTEEADAMPTTPLALAETRVGMALNNH